MPVLLVYGIADDKRNHQLEKYWDELRLIVLEVPELGLTKDQVSTFFPREAIQDGLGEEIIIFVDGLFEKSERTAEVRKRYADKLRDVTRKFFPESLIEVFVRPFNPELGFSTTAE